MFVNALALIIFKNPPPGWRSDPKCRTGKRPFLEISICCAPLLIQIFFVKNHLLRIKMAMPELVTKEEKIIKQQCNSLRQIFLTQVQNAFKQAKQATEQVYFFLLYFSHHNSSQTHHTPDSRQLPAHLGLQRMSEYMNTLDQYKGNALVTR